MKNNKKFFADRKESDNVLRYTFMIGNSQDTESLLALSSELIKNKANLFSDDAKQPEYDKINPLIENCFKSTHDTLHFLLPQYDGRKAFINKSIISFDQNINQLSILDRSKRFWYFVLRQNAIMSCYDKLRRYIAATNPIATGGAFLKYQFPIGEEGEKNTKARYGLYYLLSNHNLKNERLCRINSNSKLKPLEIPKTTQLQSNYYRSRNQQVNSYSDTLYENLCENYNVSTLGITLNAESPRKEILQLNLLEFYEFMSNRKTIDNRNSNAENIFNAQNSSCIFGAEEYKKYVDDYNKIIEELMLPYLDNVDKPYTNKLTIADKLYCRYQIEKLLGIDLADCLYRNIRNNPREDYLTGTIDFMSDIFMLPNVFSRQYIVQFAIDSLNNDFNPMPTMTHENYNYDAYDPDEYDDIQDFVNAVKNAREEVNSLYNGIDAGNTLNTVNEFACRSPFEVHPAHQYVQSETAHIYLNNMTWERSLSEMIKRLNKVIFPLYDNFFFNTFWDSVRPFCISDEQTIVNMYAILSRYLNNTETLKTLFDTEDLFYSQGSVLNTFDNSELISAFPNIKNGNFKESGNANDIDYELYHKCIQAIRKTKSYKLPPEFLSLDFLSQAKEVLRKELQESILWHHR